MADTTGMQDIGGLNVAKIVTGFALEEFKMKQLVRVQTASKWQERYYKETAADLTATTPSVIKGVSPLSTFPTLEVSWTQVNSYQIKHAAEDSISYEDIDGDDVDVLSRTLLRIARAIAKSVDSYIYTTLSDDADVHTTAATAAWDAGSGQDPIKDILVAQRKIATQNYDPLRNGVLCLSPTDYQNLVTWLISEKGASIPDFASEKVRNGVVGTLLGAKLLVANAVTADEAMYVVSQECGNYMQFKPLTTQVIDDAGIKKTIRSWEIGVCQVTNPKAIAMITNTQT
jgi:hypothetical protein